jgi:hypothetical protein
MYLGKLEAVYPHLLSRPRLAVAQGLGIQGFLVNVYLRCVCVGGGIREVLSELVVKLCSSYFTVHPVKCCSGAIQNLP